VKQRVLELQRTESQVQQSARVEARARFAEITRRALQTMRSRPAQPEQISLDQNRVLALESMVRGTLNLQDLTDAQRQRLNELLAWLEGWR
jgi:hypothetical protein